MDKIDNSLSLDNFVMLSVLGKGTYAKVLLVRRKETDEIMALKIIKKESLKKPKTAERLRAEREILVGLLYWINF
jgi:serum/glucocorticoid-regulated kinase 2